ncbi:hypothetical protein Gotur_008662 [Gossypium turneri]
MVMEPYYHNFVFGMYSILFGFGLLHENPPSVPTLVVVKWASSLRKSAFIIDLHNFRYTLLGLSVGRSSPFVSIYRWFEKRYEQIANGSLCVTREMQLELAQNWGIRLNRYLCHPLGVRDCVTAITTEIGADDQNESLFTTQVDTDILLKTYRPSLVVSSTSCCSSLIKLLPNKSGNGKNMLIDVSLWNIENAQVDKFVEIFAALLDENDSADEGVLWKEISGGKQYLYPRLLFIITGKCPEKEKYEEKIKRLNLKRVAFRTMWLSTEEYPLLLGSADLGVYRHTSSSGLDLPMKVVDMFGCGLPVCAVSYSCIDELVKVEKNGLLFSSSSELADELLMLFRGFPNKCDALKSLKSGALETGSSARWAAEWEEHAKPLISEVI